MAETTLKPCPFCGSSAKLDMIEDDERLTSSIVCLEESCRALVSPRDCTHTNLIDAWNRRALSASPPPPSVPVGVSELEWMANEVRSNLGDLYSVVQLSENVWTTYKNGVAFHGWKSTGEEAKAEAQADYGARLRAKAEAVTEYHVVFDGFPAPDGPRFIELEDATGHSIHAGEWRKRADGYCELVLKAPLPALSSALPQTEAVAWISNCYNCGRIIDTREQKYGGDRFGCQIGSTWLCSIECQDEVDNGPTAPSVSSLEEENRRLREALTRLSALTPRRANARSAGDLHGTVKAIADAALDNGDIGPEQPWLNQPSASIAEGEGK